MTDAADALFRAAKRRVFKLHGVKSRSRSKSKANAKAKAKTPPSLECVLESHPKLVELSALLAEIQREVAADSAADGSASGSESKRGGAVTILVLVPVR